MCLIWLGGVYMTEDKKYKVKIHCSNCYNNEDVEIDKGKTVDEFCNDCRCPICGCNKMTRYKGRKDRF